MWFTSRISPPSETPPSIIVPTRRRFIGSLIALVAAPAIVRISSIMPVSAVSPALLVPTGPQEEFIGITTVEVMIDGKLQFGKWKLFGVPTGRNFSTFDYDYGEPPGDWKTYQGNWEAARTTGLEGTKYRVEKVT